MTNEELAAAIRRGERERISELWAQVERFVRRYAHRMETLASGLVGADAEDLYQSGYFALLAAVETYDPSKGRSFISWLTLFLRTAFAEAGGYRTKKQRNDLLLHAGSLDAPMDADETDGDTLASLVPDPEDRIAAADERIYVEQLHAALEAALERLSPREAEVIRERYFHGRTLRELGPNAQSLTDSAMRRLRHPVISAGLRKFIEERTPYYLHVGARTFNTTRTSATEKAVLAREALEEIFRQGEISDEESDADP